MRQRLTITILGVVAATLLVASLGTLVLVHRAATGTSRQELLGETIAIGEHAPPALFKSARIGFVHFVEHAAGIEAVGLVALGPAGNIVGKLPSGIREGDLPLQTLANGYPVSGSKGNLVFAIVPITLSRRQAVGLKLPLAYQDFLVTVRKVKSPGGGEFYFLAVAGGALVIAAFIAAFLSRRITRPLVDAVETTRRIAAGDLEAKVPVVKTDLPELAALATSINTMSASLSRSRSLERQFLLSVSHDLRTPLTSIRGYAEAIGDGAAPDPAAAAAIISMEAKRLDRLVQDLLELARLDARRFSLDMQRTNCAKIVADASEGLRPAVEGAGLEFVVSIAAAQGMPDPRSWVSADPDRLGQVVANLIENAVKFATKRVMVDVTALADGVRVTVEDDGPGIPSVDLPHIFERHYTSHRAPVRAVGSGLGLAIVAELVQAMGAVVQAQSPLTPFGGTRMVLRLNRWKSLTNGCATET